MNMMIMIITVGPLEGYKNISHERTKFLLMIMLMIMMKAMMMQIYEYDNENIWI